MGPELANKFNLLQVSSVPVLLTEHHKSMVGQALMYMQHRNMVCNEFHICHDLYLDQNVNDNAYPTLLLHEALDMNHKMVMLGIGLYHNKFSHLYVRHQHYPEHDTLYLSILLFWLFPVSPLIDDSIFMIILRQTFLEFFSQTDILFWCVRMH